LRLPIGALHKQPSQEQIDDAVWTSIDNAFSSPIGPGDEYVSYVPTQIIAERFLNVGLDGIAYKSTLSQEGYNMALFDVNAAELTTCQLFNVTRVDCEFEEWNGAWFLQDGKYFTQVLTDFRPVGEVQLSEGSADDGATDTCYRP
jgi:RES domain